MISLFGEFGTRASGATRFTTQKPIGFTGRPRRKIQKVGNTDGFPSELSPLYFVFTDSVNVFGSGNIADLAKLLSWEP